MRTLAVALGFALALASARPARASVALELSVEQLTEKADLVVQGHVLGQQAAWTRGGRIVTIAHIAVDSVLKGAASGTVEVAHLGGHVGDIGQQVSGEVSFREGEEVLLFLEARRHQPGIYRVVGMSQGKFTLDRTGEMVIAHQSLDGLGLIAKPGGRIQEPAGASIPLAQLAARVARAVKP